MTTDIQKIKDDWRAQAEILLGTQPEKLAEFKQLWDAGKLQDAYMYMDEFVRDSGRIPSSEYKAADEKFYWLLR